MKLSALLLVFEIVVSAASGVTALRLYRSGLYRRYPILFCYLAFLAANALSPIIWDTRGGTYFRVWVGVHPVQWMLDILLVRELCHRVLEKHRGLFTLGRWVMYTGVAMAALVSFVSLLPHIQSTLPARSRLIAYCIAGNRAISLSLAIFLLLMLFAVSRYPVRLNRNVVLNAVLFTLCFLSDNLAAILHTIFDRRLNAVVSAADMGLEACCLLVWLFYLTPEGEQAHFDWIHFGPEYEARVLGRLDALNRILQRTA